MDKETKEAVKRLKKARKIEASKILWAQSWTQDMIKMATGVYYPGEKGQIGDF